MTDYSLNNGFDSSVFFQSLISRSGQSQCGRQRKDWSLPSCELTEYSTVNYQKITIILICIFTWCGADFFQRAIVTRPQEVGERRHLSMPHTGNALLVNLSTAGANLSPLPIPTPYNTPNCHLPPPQYWLMLNLITWLWCLKTFSYSQHVATITETTAPHQLSACSISTWTP